MDPLTNPYAPGAGAPPPELAGRDGILAAADIAIQRRGLCRPARSLVFIGLRPRGEDGQRGHFTKHAKPIRRPANPKGPKTRTFHSLRVGAAQSLAAAGAGLVEMQTAGRWESPAMPARYARGQLAARGAVARLRHGA